MANGKFEIHSLSALSAYGYPISESNQSLFLSSDYGIFERKKNDSTYETMRYGLLDFTASKNRHVDVLTLTSTYTNKVSVFPNQATILHNIKTINQISCISSISITYLSCKGYSTSYDLIIKNESSYDTYVNFPKDNTTWKTSKNADYYCNAGKTNIYHITSVLSGADNKYIVEGYAI